MKAGSAQQKRISSQDALELWRRYKATGDLNVRNQLVLAFSPLVKYIVFKKIRELPSRCEVDDFISCGLEALIAAIDRFDSVHGTTLEQFVWTRIHGAVLDELRRQDWVPRSVRRFEREITRNRDRFVAEHGRRPNAAELEQRMGMTAQQIEQREQDLSAADVSSLNALLGTEDDSTVERIDTIASQAVSLQPEFAAAGSQAKLKFRQAFAQLPQREREVAVMLYAKDLTLREIGKLLGVSESRVCQIHAQLKRTLKQTLALDADLFAAVA